MQVADSAQSARPLMTRAGWKARCAGERRGCATAAALVAGALLLAGCGASSPTAGVAHLGSTKTATTSATGGSAASGSGSPGAQALKLSACMRSHGEPDLPDPTFTGGGVHLPPSVDTHSATFESAEQACQSLIPSSLRPGAGAGTRAGG